MSRPTSQAGIVARRASRRMLRRDLVRLGGPGLLAGASASLVLVAADRVLGGLAPWPLLVGAPVALAASLSAAWCWMRRAAPLAAAAEVDRALGLKDRLSTALELETSRRDDAAFTAWAVRDGDAAARAARIREAIPIRVGWTWWTWPAAFAASVAEALFVPAVAWPARPAAADSGEPTRAAALVREATRIAREAFDVDGADAADFATPEQLRTLEEIQEQLRRGGTDPGSAMVRAAEQLDGVSRELEERAEARRLEQESLARRLASARAGDGGRRDGPEGDGDDALSPAEALSRSLERSDLDAARRAMERIAEEAPTWTPEQRDALARDLDRLAEKLAAGGASPPEHAGDPRETRESPPPAATPTDLSAGSAPRPDRPPTERPSTPGEGPPAERQMSPGAPGERRPDSGDRPEGVEPPGPAKPSRPFSDRTTRDLERRGIPPEQQHELRRPMSREELARELERRGLDPDSARRMAEQVARENQVRQAEEAAREHVEELRRALRDAARDARGEPTSGGESRPAGEHPPGATGPDRPGSTPAEQPIRKPTGTSPSEPPGVAAPQPGQDQPRPTPGGADRGVEPPHPGVRPAGEPQPGGVPQPGARDPAGARPEGERREGGGDQPIRAPAGEEREAPRPGGAAQPGERPPPGGGDAPDEPPGRELPPRGLEGLRDLMRCLADGRRDAQRDLENARRLREQGEELLRQATPDRREQLRRWTESMRDEMPGDGDRTGARGPTPPGVPTGTAFRSEPVDARRPTGDATQREQVVAQWLSDAPPDRGAAPGRSAMDEAVRSAAAGAERAIEQQVVPPRHAELVRRVFRRYAERAATPTPADRP